MKKVLSIDPGSTSIGWTLTEQNEKGYLKNFIDGGSRIFTSVRVPKTGAFKNEKRREKRQTRRNKYRSNRRMDKLENYLIKNGFLDNKIEKIENSKGLVQQIIGNPYYLRQKALKEPLTNQELSWAIMHLAKRRGFLSSSKSLTKEEKEEQAKSEELALDMKNKGFQTLGEYFYNRLINGEKVRNEKLKRQLVREELSLILEKQKETNSNITDDFIYKINDIIFFQRPLKIQKRVSICTLESKGKIKKYTSAKYHPLSQKFIIWSFINNLKYDKNGVMNELKIDEKQKIFNLLWKNKEITYKKVIKELNFPQNTTFNYQKDEKDKLKGNQILTYLNKNTKEWFNSLSESKKEQLINEIATINDLTGNILKRRLYKWTQNEEIINNLLMFSDKMPQGYTSLSIKAIKKILPFLEQGDMFYIAKEKAYPNNKQENKNKIKKLPPVQGVLNHVVMKSCTQIRHLVNAIIDQYGSIDIIKLELARDLSKSKKQISEINKKSKENLKLNEEAKEYLIKNNINITKDNILKYKLHKECKGESCYPEKDKSGNWYFPKINLTELYDSYAKYEIEHIIPKSISGDDSFFNKSLCSAKINHLKLNKTPYEYYYSQGGHELIDMIAKNAYKKLGKQKGKRFVITAESYLEENPFQKRFLNDTRYLSMFLKDYLSPVCDNIIVSKGGFTAIIRQSLNLNKLLGKDFIKNRADHRHHMVDALCTSIVSPNVLNLIEKMRKQVSKKTNQYKELEDKLKNYVKNIENDFLNHFEKVITSHEVDNKLKGELEEESLYGHDKIQLQDGKILEKLFLHKPYQDVINGKSPKQLLEEHNNFKISLPKGLKKYLQKNNKLPDYHTGWKRIKVYYDENAITDENFNIEGFRKIIDKKGNIQGYKKTDSKAYTIVYNDYSNEAILKINAINNKIVSDNILFKLYRGDLIMSPEGNIFKIYQLPKNKISIHPVNEIKIEGRDLKNYSNAKVNSKKPTIKNIFEKQKYYKINVNILGHIV